MFTILGADGKEYGPVTAGKVIEWMQGGRANAQTRIKRVGDAEWSTIGAFPEFGGSDGNQAATPPPVAPSAAPRSTPAPDAGSMIARARPLDITGCIRNGWATGLANYWPIFGVSLLIGLCGFVVGVMLGIIPFLGMVANLMLNGVFYGGLYYYVLKKLRRETTEIGDAFSGFSVCFMQLALASLVVTLLVLLGCVLLILPGIYLAVCWMFTFPLVRDKGLEFWPAMELGRQVITAQWFRVFGLLLLIFALTLVLLAVPVCLVFMGGITHGGVSNYLFMGLGVLSAIVIGLGLGPLVSCTLMHAYEELFNPPHA